MLSSFRVVQSESIDERGNRADSNSFETEISVGWQLNGGKTKNKKKKFERKEND